jgi:hypothetical protein
MTVVPPPWYAQCAANAQEQGWPLCPDTMCESQPFQSYSQAYCNCEGPFANGCSPQRTPGCCAFDAASPIPIIESQCFCCCGGAAGPSLSIAYAAGAVKAAEEYAVGDDVYVADDRSLGTWSRRPVVWSAGVGAAANTMLHVEYAAGDGSEHVVVAPEQLFLTAQRRLQAAATLVPGVDALVAADGSSRPVLALEAGQLARTIHGLSTSREPATSPDGHLILAGGVVCGDWALQIASCGDGSPELGLVDDHAALPRLATPEYRAAHPDLEHSDFGARSAGSAPAAAPAGFVALADIGPGPSLTNAVGFLSPAQANEIKDRVPQLPPTAQIVNSVVQPLLRSFRGVYPHFTFSFDRGTLVPNAYVCERDGVPTIVLTAGLAATRGVGRELLALALAHSVGVSVGGPPEVAPGESCVGQADLAATGAILPQVFRGPILRETLTAGIAQAGALFDEIVVNRGGTHRCSDPSLDCRLAALHAGFELGALPECAGGDG